VNSRISGEQNVSAQVSASQWKQSGVGMEGWKVMRVTKAGWRFPLYRSVANMTRQFWPFLDCLIEK
jgi:hypothetical protein